MFSISDPLVGQSGTSFLSMLLLGVVTDNLWYLALHWNTNKDSTNCNVLFLHSLSISEDPAMYSNFQNAKHFPSYALFSQVLTFVNHVENFVITCFLLL